MAATTDPDRSPHPPGTALVTGATRGIGRGIAEGFAQLGWSVRLTGRDPDALDEVAAACRALGAPDASTVAADLRDPAAVGRIWPVDEPAGSDPRTPEVLVHNAGTAPTARLEDTDDALLDEVLDLHVRAPLRLIRAALPAFRGRGRGTVLLMGSTAGLRAYPFTSAYTVAKHGTVGLARSVAAEARKCDLRAYALCPGFVDTDITRSAAAAVAARGKTSAEKALAQMAAMNGIRRMHTVAEVADAAVRLCTERPEGCVYLLDADPPRFVDR